MPARDSSVLLYCIGRPGASVPALSGLRDLPLRWIAERSLAALVSDCPLRDVLTRPQVADLLTFERAVASAHAAGDVLPVRFGCEIGDEKQLRALLREHEQTYLDSLARIAGCVELGVRVELTEATETPETVRPQSTENEADADRPASGTAYLRARQTHYLRVQRAQERSSDVCTEIQQSFAGLFREAQVRAATGAAEAEPVSVAFLVERAAVEAFRTRFAALRLRAAHKPVLLGPWPPFSFSAERPSDPPGPRDTPAPPEHGG